MATYSVMENQNNMGYSPTHITTDNLAYHIRQVLSKLLGPSSIAYSAATNSPWYLDSACSNHMTNDTTIFSSKRHTQETVHTADGTIMPITHIGTASTTSFSLSDTFYVPKLALNLVSIGQLVEQGIDVSFSITGCRLQDRQTGQLLGTGRKVGRLFELDNFQLPSSV